MGGNIKTSVVIATYNRKNLLKRGLYTLLNQTVLPTEIIVVDDGSSDGTDEYLRNVHDYTKMKDHLPDVKPVILTDHPEPRISCIPRNIGIKKALGDVIIFTEPEALQVGDTIAALLHKMHRNPENTILASQVWTTQEKIAQVFTEEDYQHPEKIIKHPYAMMTDNEHPHNTKAPDSDWSITGEMNCNAGVLFATRKEWLEEVSGFDESFEGHGFDDFDLFNRLALIGHGVLKAPDIAVIHMWHPKGFYKFNIYQAAEKNGEISEKNVKANKFKVNGDSWGEI